MTQKTAVSFRLSPQVLLNLKSASYKTGLSQALLVERCLISSLGDLVARITGEGYVPRPTATPTATPSPGSGPTPAPTPRRSLPGPGVTAKPKPNLDPPTPLIEGGVRENQAVVWPLENIARAFGVSPDDIIPMVDPEDDLGPIDGVPHGGLVVVTAANLAASLPRPDILAWARAVQPED